MTLVNKLIGQPDKLFFFMNKTQAIFIFFFLLIQCAFSETISIEPICSYSFGQLDEIYYYPESYDGSKKISLLEWDRNVFLFGANIHSSFKNMHASAQALSSIPNQKSGTMDDSDFLNTDDYDIKTRYSTGANNAAISNAFEFSLGYDFKTTHWLSFSPCASIQFFYDSFERKTAEGWYNMSNGWWYDEDSIHYPRTFTNSDGKTVTQKLGEIDFMRKSFITWLGFSAIAEPAKKFRIRFGFQISPYAFSKFIDTHMAQDKLTKEKFGIHTKMIQSSYFNLLSLFAGAEYDICDRISLTLAFRYAFTISPARGTLLRDYIGTDRQSQYFKTEYESGANNANAEISAGVKIKIL